MTEVTTDNMVLDHLGLARKIAYRYLNTPMELDDLEQTARLGLIRAARAYDPGRGIAFSTFAWRVIENEINKALRKTRKQSRELTILDDDTKEDARSILETLAAGDDVEGAVLQRELYQKVSVYLAEIPERNRGWIIQYFFLGESQGSIAARDGVKQPNVSKVIRRAIKRIRKRLEEEGLCH